MLHVHSQCQHLRNGVTVGGGQAMRCPFTHPTGGGGRDSGVPPAHLHQPQTWCGSSGPTSTVLCNEVTDAYMSLQPEQQQSVTIGCSRLVQQTLSYSPLCLLAVKYFGQAVLRPSRGNLPPCAPPSYAIFDVIDLSEKLSILTSLQCVMHRLSIVHSRRLV